MVAIVRSLLLLPLLLPPTSHMVSLGMPRPVPSGLLGSLLL